MSRVSMNRRTSSRLPLLVCAFTTVTFYFRSNWTDTERRWPGVAIVASMGFGYTHGVSGVVVVVVLTIIMPTCCHSLPLPVVEPIFHGCVWAGLAPSNVKTLNTRGLESCTLAL